jgi:hypothetical protein
VTIAPVPVPRAELDGWLDRLEALAIEGNHDAARAALLAFTSRAVTHSSSDVHDADERRLRAVETRS